jgi:hypothetical protein
VALIRGSLHLHQYRGWPASVALAAGALATAAIVALYGIWLVRRVTGRLHVRAVVRWFAVPVVTFYAIYGLVYVSSANLKHERLRAYYATLHPLLRVALATVILADEELVLTDLERRPEDYRAMGLAVNPASLHARQPDGWAHAVDLRTVGRSAVRNRLVQWYFEGMGFATLRHVGRGSPASRSATRGPGPLPGRRPRWPAVSRGALVIVIRGGGDLRQSCLDLRLRQPASRHHDARAALEVGHVHQRVRVEQDQVGPPAGRHRAEVVPRAVEVRHVAGPGREDLERRQSGRRHDARLAVDAEARHAEQLRRIGARESHAPRFALGHGGDLGPGRCVGLLVRMFPRSHQLSTHWWYRNRQR